MKNFFRLSLIFLFLMAAVSGFSQHNKPCDGPMPNNKFRQKFDQLASMQNESMKLKKAKELVFDFCVTSEQVKDIASLFANDYNRLDFAQAAYANVTDKENFYDVYDSFAYFSNVFRLHDFVKEGHGHHGSHEPPVVVVPTPPVVLPPPPSQQGNPCIVNTPEFKEVTESISKQSFNSTKVTIAKQIITAKRCFTSEQIRDIVKLFTFEDSRLEIAKFAWDFCIDKQNYFKVNDAFTFSSSSEELAKFISGKH
jgi:hypothetical protein